MHLDRIKIEPMSVYRFLILLAALTSPVYAQDYTSFNSWYLLLNHYEINEQWKVGNEFHFRFEDWDDSQQLLIRPFVSYSPSKRSTLTGGYTYIESYPYGPYAFDGVIREHNIWEQVELKHESKAWKFIHRYRLEQRWITSYDTIGGEFNFNNPITNHRFRYRLTVKRDLGEQYFLHIFDELWVRSALSGDSPTYDRNWLFLAVGKRIGTGNVQLGYLHQNIRRGDLVSEVHPTLQFVFQYDF